MGDILLRQLFGNLEILAASAVSIFRKDKEFENNLLGDNYFPEYKTHFCNPIYSLQLTLNSIRRGNVELTTEHKQLFQRLHANLSKVYNEEVEPWTDSDRLNSFQKDEVKKLASVWRDVVEALQSMGKIYN